MTHIFVTIVVTEGNHTMDLFYHFEHDEHVWTYDEDEIIRHVGLEKRTDGEGDMTFLGELMLVSMYARSITEEQLKVLRDLKIV